MTDFNLKTSVILRMSIVAGLTLLLLIPAAFVESLVSERDATRKAAALNVSQSWGGVQTLAGPVLTLPYRIYYKDTKGGVSSVIHHAHFLPSDLHIRGSMDPEIRYRGIYEVVLYRAGCTIEGSFARPDVAKLGIHPADVVWDDAFLSYGITDLQGIRDSITLKWNDTAYPSEPGVPVDDVFSSGITFKPPVSRSGKSFTFSIPLHFNGSSEIRFVPAGEVTNVAIQSAWGTPSFVGSFLPHRREIRADGFQAEWKVFSLNRNYPQAWTDNRYKILESSFGTTFFLPVDQYQKTTRSIKYALLFISLTFASFFMSELMAKVSLHPIHYTLIGFALVLFYLLLLSLSEHVRFDLAYLIAGAGTTLLVSLYAYWISIRKQIAGVIFSILSVLYGFLFVVLQLEDYALLLGSVGLFVILAAVMYLTRRIDWFAVNQAKA